MSAPNDTDSSYHVPPGIDAEVQSRIEAFFRKTDAIARIARRATTNDSNKTSNSIPPPEDMSSQEFKKPSTFPVSGDRKSSSKSRSAKAYELYRQKAQKAPSPLKDCISADEISDQVALEMEISSRKEAALLTTLTGSASNKSVSQPIIDPLNDTSPSPCRIADKLRKLLNWMCTMICMIFKSTPAVIEYSNEEIFDQVAKNARVHAVLIPNSLNKSERRIYLTTKGLESSKGVGIELTCTNNRIKEILKQDGKSVAENLLKEEIVRALRSSV